jgi:hypothetical protein
LLGENTGSREAGLVADMTSKVNKSLYDGVYGNL